MGNVIADISMSLDGFIAGPDDGPELGLGRGGERLHEWVVELASWRKYHGMQGGKSGQADQILEEGFASTGAFLMGRRMFDIAEEPWGPNPPFHKPVFVITHRAHATLEKEGGTTFTFVTDGLETALQKARAAAGEKHVAVAGGANVIQQFLAANLLDEIQIHLVPVLLGGGRSLFDALPKELKFSRILESPGVLHLKLQPVE